MTVEEAIQTFQTAPILFVGSGFSRRYGNAPDWKGLLQKLAAEILPEHPFAYERYLNDARKQMDAEDECECFPLVAETMKQEFDDRFFKEPSFAERFIVNATDVRRGISPFLSYLSGYFSRVRKAGLTQELQDELSDLAIAAKHSVDGVITTNYDGLLEGVFKDFQVFVGQKDMLTGNPTGCLEMYKIHGSYTEPASLIFTKKSYDLYRENAPYLYAKLLTFFIEHPILFLGYSLKDPDIRDIFASLTKCLNATRMQNFLDNMVFVQYDNQAHTPVVKIHSFDFGTASVNMKCIQIDSYGPIFKALVKIKRRYDVKKLRQIRQDVYHTVVSNEPTDSIRIFSEKILESGNPQGDVMGFSMQPKYENVYVQLSSEQVYANIILENQDINVRSLVKDWLPKHLSRCEYPVFYYAKRAQENMIELPAPMTEYVDKHQSLDSFFAQSVEKA